MREDNQSSQSTVWDTFKDRIDSFLEPLGVLGSILLISFGISIIALLLSQSRIDLPALVFDLGWNNFWGYVFFLSSTTLLVFRILAQCLMYFKRILYYFFNLVSLILPGARRVAQWFRYKITPSTYIEIKTWLAEINPDKTGALTAGRLFDITDTGKLSMSFKVRNLLPSGHYWRAGFIVHFRSGEKLVFHFFEDDGGQEKGKIKYLYSTGNPISFSQLYERYDPNTPSPVVSLNFNKEGNLLVVNLPGMQEPAFVSSNVNSDIVSISLEAWADGGSFAIEFTDIVIKSLL
jgi:hypothetical protein